EQSLDIHYNQENDVLDYLADPGVFAYHDGFVDAPTEPGLGIDLDEEYIEDRSDEEVDWHNHVRRHDVGSVAECRRGRLRILFNREAYVFTHRYRLVVAAIPTFGFVGRVPSVSSRVFREPLRMTVISMVSPGEA